MPSDTTAMNTGWAVRDRWGDSDDLGARCIARSTDPERITVLGACVADDEARRVLAAGRRALAADKRYWGAEVFAQLAQQVLGEPGSAERIPTEGFVVIPLTPVLERLAGISARCRERCLDYLDAQIVLCELTVSACLAGEQSSAGTRVVRLRSFLGAYHVLRSVLLSHRVVPGDMPEVVATEVETWLESSPPAASALPGAGPLA